MDKTVSDVKLLGVHFDSKLDFNIHCNNICKKVNTKLFRLKKHSFLFTNDFKIILFKLFILPIFDYCSSLFITIKLENFRKLNKSYCKAVKALLHIDIYNQQLEKQICLLKVVNVSPLILRFFIHYCIFIFKLFTKNNTPSIHKFFNKNQCTMSIRNHYSINRFNTDYKKFSFSIIATKLLNEFINGFIVNTTKLDSFIKFIISSSYSFYDKLHVFFGHNDSYFI